MESQKIYQWIKEKIVWMDFKPGEQINLNNISNKFNVSRTPIKEALIQLHGERWISRENAHFNVTKFDVEFIRDITEMRSIIEPQAVILAYKRITHDELQELSRLKEEINRLSEDVSMEEMLRMDHRFHNILYRATKNKEMSHVLENYHNHYFRFWLSFPRRLEKSYFFREIFASLQAIEEKDQNTLLDISRKHIKNSAADLLGVFQG